MSYIVVSFCNVMAGGPVLALIDVATSDVQTLRVPGWQPQFGGITGLAASDRYLYAVMQRQPGPSFLLIIDRDGLRLRTEYACSSVLDAHSILVADGGLYAVSSGTDEVIRIGLEGAEVTGEELVWRPDPAAPRQDVHHLNAIYLYRGDMLVAGFGRRTGSQWSSAINGFIVNVTTGERIASGLRHPHSLIELDGGIAFCESGTMTLRVAGSARSRRLVGYPRGLCRIGDKLFVGVSRGRQISRSTGALVNRTDLGSLANGEGSNTLVGRCSVVRLSVGSLEVEAVVDVDDYGWEIYDLLPLEDASGWPVVPELDWRREAVSSLRESLDERDSMIARLHIDVADLQRAVTERDQILARFGVLALNRLRRRLRAASGRPRSTRRIQSMLARLEALVSRLRRVRRAVVGRNEDSRCGS